MPASMTVVTVSTVTPAPTKPVRPAYAVGQVHERWCPFIVEDRELVEQEPEGVITRTIKSWRPGVRMVPVPPDTAEPEWDGDGKELRRIVAITTVEGGGVRILYRRTWQKPDGSTFGKNTVRMTTPSGFTTWQRARNGFLRNWRPWG